MTHRNSSHYYIVPPGSVPPTGSLPHTGNFTIMNINTVVVGYITAHTHSFISTATDQLVSVCNVPEAASPVSTAGAGPPLLTAVWDATQRYRW